MLHCISTSLVLPHQSGPVSLCTHQSNSRLLTQSSTIPKTVQLLLSDIVNVFRYGKVAGHGSFVHAFLHSSDVSLRTSFTREKTILQTQPYQCIQSSLIPIIRRPQRQNLRTRVKESRYGFCCRQRCSAEAHQECTSEYGGNSRLEPDAKP